MEFFTERASFSRNIWLESTCWALLEDRVRHSERDCIGLVLPIILLVFSEMILVVSITCSIFSRACSDESEKELEKFKKFSLSVESLLSIPSRKLQIFRSISDGTLTDGESSCTGFTGLGGIVSVARMG